VPINVWLFVNSHQEWSKENFRSPLVVPPLHTPVMLPVGQMSCAARMHCSHLSLDMLIVASGLAGARTNLADPECPTVFAGSPLHLVTDPAMPPHIDS
jgi:hypothetical protein